MKKMTTQKVCDALPIGARMTVAQLCEATGVSSGTMTSAITRLIDARVLKPVDEVVLPTGGKTRIYSRVMDLPAVQKPRRASQAYVWTPPVKFASVFHYARGASL